MTARQGSGFKDNWRFLILKHLTVNTKLCSSIAGEGKEESSICGGTDWHSTAHTMTQTQRPPPHSPPGRPALLAAILWPGAGTPFPVEPGGPAGRRRGAGPGPGLRYGAGGASDRPHPQRPPRPNGQGTAAESRGRKAEGVPGASQPRSRCVFATGSAASAISWLGSNASFRLAWQMVEGRAWIKARPIAGNNQTR